MCRRDHGRDHRDSRWPDTTSFIEANPQFAAAFRELLTHWPSGEDEILYLDFSLDASTQDPFLKSYVHWYQDYLDRVLGFFLVRSSHEGANVILRDFERPIPFHSVPGTERAAILYGSNIIAYESFTAALLEEGIGLIAEYTESLFGGHSTTILLWARVGGVEYGQRPTAVDRDSWAEVKRNLADGIPCARRLINPRWSLSAR
jgi:hypothetical protein